MSFRMKSLSFPAPAAPSGFEVPPDAIDPNAIVDIIDADVVVVGAGFAGLTAAASAAEAGARTILLEKSSNENARGLAIASVGSRQQKRAGYVNDRDEVIDELMRWGAYKPDQRVVSLWVDRSGEVMDWVEDIVNRAGIETVIVPPTEQTRHGPYKYFPVINMRIPAEGAEAQRPHLRLARVLREHAVSAGVDFRFNAPAVQLVQTAQGVVTGVIAKTKDGFVQYNAAGGVILCTGDYGHNPEMLAKYAPHTLKVLNNIYPGPWNTGDGHKMGLWAGAAMDEAPHCALIFDIGFPDSEDIAFPVPLARQPFLNLNLRGERYVNEDLPYAFICNADLQQPEATKWVIWDSSWEEDAARFNTLYCKFMGENAPMHRLGVIEDLIAKDVIKTAATIEELVAKMALPATEAMDAIARYNVLARDGYDQDFGKPAECLSTIDEAPFYAVKLSSSLLVTLGGLKINTRLEVLDRDGDAIQGLYAAGNTSGSFFANDYPIGLAGVSHGRALTFGRLAGLNAAARVLPAVPEAAVPEAAVPEAVIPEAATPEKVAG